jgi:catechol 2,3-dioxygenase-like lactoylglutathione lyase family enzyme
VWSNFTDSPVQGDSMKFICTIIVVEDIARSRKLYETILHQKVTADFGEFNVAFEGGLALYKRGLYQSLIGDQLEILNKTNNFELYFEEDNLLEFEREISSNGFEFIHGIREEPWKQQVFRFYDYDHNVVVIAETMEQVSTRLFKENHSVEEISRMTGFPVEEVLRQIAQ